MKLVIFALMLVMSTFATAAEYAYGPQKVVYQVNGTTYEEYDWVIKYAKNHVKAVGSENIDLRIVLHGPGVFMLQQALTNKKLQQGIDALRAQGVTFNVCANALRAFNLDAKTDLYNVKESDVVPAGVGEIIKLQQEGFHFLKP